LAGVKKSRKIAEGMPGEAVTAETVIILDFEGMQCTSILSITKLLKKAGSLLSQPSNHSASLSACLREANITSFHKTDLKHRRSLEPQACQGFQRHPSPSIPTKGAVHYLPRIQAALNKVVSVTTSEKQEVKMRLITRFELAAKNENELRGLLREVFNELVRSEPDTHQSRNALASIENI